MVRRLLPALSISLCLHGVVLGGFGLVSAERVLPEREAIEVEIVSLGLAGAGQGGGEGGAPVPLPRGPRGAVLPEPGKEPTGNGATGEKSILADPVKQPGVGATQGEDSKRPAATHEASGFPVTQREVHRVVKPVDPPDDGPTPVTPSDAATGQRRPDPLPLAADRKDRGSPGDDRKDPDGASTDPNGDRSVPAVPTMGPDDHAPSGGKELASLLAGDGLSGTGPGAVGEPGAAGAGIGSSTGTGWRGGAAGEGALGPATGGRTAHGPLLEHLRQHANRCYPRSLSRRGTKGTVEVSFCVTGEGQPREERVVQTSGSTLLDRAAIDCVIRGSAPLPALPACYTVPIRFFTR